MKKSKIKTKKIRAKIVQAKGFNPGIVDQIAEAAFNSLQHEGIRSWTPYTIDDGCTDAKDSYASRMSRVVSSLDDEGDAMFPKKAAALVDELLDDERNFGMTENIRHLGVGQIIGIARRRLSESKSMPFDKWREIVIDRLVASARMEIDRILDRFEVWAICTG